MANELSEADRKAALDAFRLWDDSAETRAMRLNSTNPYWIQRAAWLHACEWMKQYAACVAYERAAQVCDELAEAHAQLATLCRGGAEAGHLACASAVEQLSREFRALAKGQPE